jgi:hypothetical protein
MTLVFIRLRSINQEGGKSMNIQMMGWVAILLSGVASQVLGMLWYSPLLFGKVWAKEMGYVKMTPAKKKKMQKEAIPGYIATFIGSMIMAFVLLHLLQHLHVNSIHGVLRTVVWSWLGFTATAMAAGQFFGQRSWKLFLIDSLYQLATFVVAGLILLKLYI